MKKTITLILCLCLTTVAIAQKTINAEDIMADITEGKNISYNNVTINGDLDFTFMDDAMKKLPKKRKNNWWNGNSTNEVDYTITVDISFTNCVFKNDVLAYIPDEDSGYTFTADFNENAIFKNCKFEGKAMFKYSSFEKDSDFSGAIFEDDTTFKYAKFFRNSDFSNTQYAEAATFKYSEFNRNVSFANSVFEDSAVFKYTKFKDGVSFKNVSFEEDLNIKYMKVSGDFNITGMKVAYDIDSKYTKINGKGFSKYLLESRN